MLLRRTAPVAIVAALAVSLAGITLSGQRGAGGGGGGMAGGRGAGPPGGRGAAPTRDASDQAATGTGLIAGIATVAGSGAPVRRARVTLTAPELRGARTAPTDDNGRFLFPGLPAGRYSLTISKAGFVDMAYGAKRPGRQGTPIQLAEGQHLDQLRISVPRGGVITGIVVDEHGEPAPGMSVRAFRYVMRTGERTVIQAGQDQTDDRGVYRIYQLQPGDYIVAAVPRNVTGNFELREMVASQLTSLTQIQGGRGGAPFEFGVVVSGPNSDVAERVVALQQQLASLETSDGPTAYAPVYYPGTTSASSALSITIGAGEERGGVDFRLQLVPTTRLTGIVTGPDGTLPPGTQVALVPDRQRGGLAVPGLGSTATRVGPDGRFTFNNVTPGDYLLQARAVLRDGGARAGRGAPMGNIAQVLWASAEVPVSGQPLPDIVLDLRPGMTVSGQVSFVGSGQSAPDPSLVRVALTPRGSQAFEMGGMAMMAQADSAGRFTIAGVSPGRYALTFTITGGGRAGRGGQPVSSSAGGWTLKSAMFNGQDLLDFPIEIRPNQSLSNVAVTYTDRTQELSGTIQDASGGPTSDFTIIVFPTDRRYWLPQARRIAATRPGTDGRFTFRGLPAGSYRLTAVTDVEPGEWYDPAFLSQIETASIPIALMEGEQKVQDIRLAGGG